jgi:hypothetical protein
MLVGCLLVIYVLNSNNGEHLERKDIQRTLDVMVGLLVCGIWVFSGHFELKSTPS